jgi:succinyl-CoA synthetase alpha subunit
VVCLGGDPVIGTGHRDILARFEADPDTDAVALLGEIGGHSEIEAAEIVGAMRTPVVALVVGRSAPPGKRMGHAGALLGGDDENAPAKAAALERAGAFVAEGITEVAPLVHRVLAERRQ